jgi:hypothetical protein
MYKILVSKEDCWEEVETSSLSLEETILRVLELEKLNLGEIYCLEEITNLGNKVIEFN